MTFWARLKHSRLKSTADAWLCDAVCLVCLVLTAIPAAFLCWQLVQGSFCFSLRLPVTDHPMSTGGTDSSPFSDQAPFAKKRLGDVRHVEPPLAQKCVMQAIVASRLNVPLAPESEKWHGSAHRRGQEDRRTHCWYRRQSKSRLPELRAVWLQRQFRFPMIDQPIRPFPLICRANLKVGSGHRRQRTPLLRPCGLMPAFVPQNDTIMQESMFANEQEDATRLLALRGSWARMFGMGGAQERTRTSTSIKDTST